jgi:hypothetical protein
MRKAVALLLLLVTAGCATGQYVTSGEVLEALGRTFLDVADKWKAAHARGLVSDEEYRQFAVFAVRFQNAYQAAYQLWLAGEPLTNLKPRIDELVQELSAWGAKLSQR